MPSTEEKIASYTIALEMIEMLNELKEITEMLGNVPFEELTPEKWDSVREIMQPINLALTSYRDTIQLTHKVLDNDALFSHINAVMTAED